MALEHVDDQIDRKSIGRSSEIVRVQGTLRTSPLDVVNESPLSECHVLVNDPENLEQEEMDRAKNCLTKIVKFSDHPSLSLQVRDSHKLPDRTSSALKKGTLTSLQEGEITRQKLKTSLEFWSRNLEQTTFQSFRKGNEIR